MASGLIQHPGMRIIHLPSTSQVAYCGIAVHAGSRHEEPSQQGMAHFCEHLTFKGTARRTATQVINAIEGLGGELNAFTNKEDTVFYCVIEQRHLRRALDVLQDIVFHSQYPEQELEKEREVVCDEIESYEDTPAELIFDEFENILFEGHPLGHNILGTREQLRSYTSEDALRFKQKWYRPENCVLFMTQSLPAKERSNFLQDNLSTDNKEKLIEMIKELNVEIKPKTKSINELFKYYFEHYNNKNSSYFIKHIKNLRKIKTEEVKIK